MPRYWLNFAALATVFALGVLTEMALIIGVQGRIDGSLEPRSVLGILFVLPLVGVVLAPVLVLQLLAWGLAAEPRAALYVGLASCGLEAALAQGGRALAFALLAPVPIVVGWVAMRYRPRTLEARNVLRTAALIAALALMITVL